ncbi:MAG: alkaline phosphatase D family protein, partial [Bacteroidia bacterium]|nr:alkaline phosphatase D family protein [Bacteroidia bacterium]
MRNKLSQLAFCLLLATTVSAQFDQRVQLNPILKPFYHGVASGDPLTDRVILWTRVTPDTAGNPIQVNWRIATDTTFTTIINSGTVTTTPDRDYTVKVEATGLQPNTWYYYEFSALGRKSLIGRTKTLPTGNLSNLRMAVTSCSDYQAGYFHAYRNIVQRNDADIVLHLGDYIYEYTRDVNNTIRPGLEPPTEIKTLEDYRARYSWYRLDNDLRTLHQQFPIITVWDDHESANDSYKDGAENHTEGAEGLWVDRKAAAIRAYNEWQPLRTNVTDSAAIYRKFQFGNLVDLMMVDTRLYGRSKQESVTNTAALADTNRTILGTQQMNWFRNQLGSSTAIWKIMGNQVMFAPLRIFGFAVNADQWDGYVADRNRITSFIEANNINNFVVLTGDIHSSWANDIPKSNYNGQTGTTFGVEFVTPG